MPGVITHKALVLLVRERLAHIVSLLDAKLASPTVPATDLEHRVRALAKLAGQMLSTAPAVDVPNGAFGAGASKYGILGGVGPDLPGFSWILAPGQSWVYDTLHKGNPDESREMVDAATTDFVLALWGELKNRSSDEAVLGPMRAYLLGHVCHIAADVVSHPYADDRQWRFAPADGRKLSRDSGEREIDALVARKLFGATGVRARSWDGFWLDPEDVPDVFFDAFAAAFTTVYLTPSRPLGTAELESVFAPLALAAPTADQLRDGYSFLVHGFLGTTYRFGHWGWAGLLTPAALGLWLLFPLSALMPNLRSVWASPNVDGGRVVYEMLAFPLAMAAPVALAYGIYATALSHKGATGLVVTGLVLAAIETGLAVAFFSTLGTPADKFPYWLRGLLFVGVPAGVSIGFFIYALKHMERTRGFPWFRPRAHEGARGVVGFLYALPLLVMVLFALFFLLIVLGRAIGGAGTGTTVEFGVLVVIMFALSVAGWQLLAQALRDAFIPEQPQVDAELAPVPERPHLVRAFDDGTLVHPRAVVEPALVAPRDTAVTALPRLQFPSARRRVLKLWWEGTGDLYIRSDRVALVFSAAADGSGATQTVPAPVAPMTATEYGAFLSASVTTPGGAAADTGKLKAAPAFDEGALDANLPAGATFSDHGDGATSIADHDAQASQFIKLGTKNDDGAYVLFHAPRSQQSVRVGIAGPVFFDGHEDGAVAGEGKIRSAGTFVRGTGTFFRTFFTAGDTIRVGAQDRTVTSIRADDQLVVHSAFDDDLTAATDYQRVGFDDEHAGFRFVTDSAGAGPGGDTIMDYAADLGALLCMGLVPHLVGPDAAADTLRAAKTKAGGAAVDPTLPAVYQVFRNWNLDRRRINEWRMLVAGGALSEKHGPSETYDEAMTSPRPSDYHPRAAGEATALGLGWVPLLRRWLSAVAPASGDALAPAAAGQPQGNVNLSNGLAFLLDLPDPTALA